MKKLIVVNENLNLKTLDVDEHNFRSILSQTFPNFTNSVKTHKMVDFFNRTDIVMLTHDLFTSNMELNLIGTALYSGDYDYAIAGEIAFAKEVLNHEYESNLVGLDINDIDRDIYNSLVDLCDYMKEKIADVER